MNNLFLENPYYTLIYNYSRKKLMNNLHMSKIFRMFAKSK